MIRRFFLTLAFVVVIAGCRRDRSSELAEVVNVSDEAFAPQLLRGFHPVEEHSWRWTQSKFAVALKPPKQSGQGAVLVLRYSVPEAVFAKMKDAKISSRVEGIPMQAEPIAKAGLQEMRRDVPADALKGKSGVTIDFSVEPFLPPSDADQRELGVIVHSIGLVKRS